MDNAQVNTILLIRYLEIPSWRWEVEHKSLPLLEHDIHQLRLAGRYRSVGVASYQVVEARGKGTTSNPTLSMVCDDHSQAEFERVFHDVISRWNTQQEILHECILLEDIVTKALYRVDSTLEQTIRHEISFTHIRHYQRKASLPIPNTAYTTLASALHTALLPSIFPNISVTYPGMFVHISGRWTPRGN